MTEKTYIKGKDKDLESTIKTMKEKLLAIGIHVEASSVLNPVPYVHSLHIHDSDYRMMFTNGKGASKLSCEASALGEYFERLSCNYFFADYYLGEYFAKADFVHYPNEKWFTYEEEDDDMPEGLLDEKLWLHYDPDEELEPCEIFDTNSGVGERGICALPFTRQSDNKEIYFPVNIIGNIYVSNGMAAGNTKEEARVQALSEIFERYAKNKIIAEGICLPLIPQEVLSRFPHILESIKKLEDEGFSLRICDASLGGIYPVISVTLINPKDGSVLASFGGHPCFEVALERTVTELLQGRSLDMLNDFHAPSLSLDEVADPQNIEEHFINSTGLIAYEFFKEEADYDFVDWNFDSSTSEEFEHLSKVIQGNDFDIYIADYDHLGVYACRIIVPGMSDIYPVDDLQWSNNNEGAHFREAILNLKNLDNDELEEFFDALEELNDMTKVCEFIGVVADPNTVWQRLQMGELKLMTALALGESEQAKEYNTWVLQSLSLDDERTRFHRCLEIMLDIKLDKEKDFKSYVRSLSQMYGEEVLQNCVDIINKKENFFGLHSPGLSLDGFVNHNKLLEGYAKLHKAKAQ
ncbi:YcaO-like family protein [Sulfurimonas sp. MAG313]|nr:30S ribosomal protein S12 methylthiotransferase accessory factor YcaO [Sulfurimonas sp. MAG313]MDF1880053.1 YcaO-like family protein [Sulfurimonas sp. MAG313]